MTNHPSDLPSYLRQTVAWATHNKAALLALALILLVVTWVFTGWPVKNLRVDLSRSRASDRDEIDWYVNTISSGSFQSVGGVISRICKKDDQCGRKQKCNLETGKCYAVECKNRFDCGEGRDCNVELGTCACEGYWYYRTASGECRHCGIDQHVNADRTDCECDLEDFTSVGDRCVCTGQVVPLDVPPYIRCLHCGPDEEPSVGTTKVSCVKRRPTPTPTPTSTLTPTPCPYVLRFWGLCTTPTPTPTPPICPSGYHYSCGGAGISPSRCDCFPDCPECWGD